MGRFRRILRMAWFIVYPFAFIWFLTLQVESGAKVFLLLVLVAIAAVAIFMLYRERRTNP